jgi:PKHD-type hydroxylase
VRYAAGDGFGWHTDLGDGAASTRKLSVSVQLSDPESYAGGGFELCPHGTVEKFAPRGSALVFPAYMPHRVADVTRGVRRALVAWVHGDAFV